MNKDIVDTEISSQDIVDDARARRQNRNKKSSFVLF